MVYFERINFKYFSLSLIFILFKIKEFQKTLKTKKFMMEKTLEGCAEIDLTGE